MTTRLAALTVAALIPAALGPLALTLSACGGGAGTTSPTAANAATGSGKGAASGSATSRTVPTLIPPAGSPSRSARVPVLTYHRVVSLPAVGALDLIVDPANFAAELKAMHDAGYHTIHQAQLFDALYHGSALPRKPIIISLDDGYVDDVRTVLPALQRWHMVATFFVITGRTAEPGFLSADQIRELDRAGMDVGDHTAHHVDLRLLSAGQLQSETAGSRRALDSILGHPVYYFAYPFGAHNSAVIQALRGAGFTMAYTTAGGITENSAAAFTMPRLHIGRSETPSGLVSLLGSA
jgi:peptidoglycan/xylan/chitin deacetylase (PgdA/CDA1 family)